MTKHAFQIRSAHPQDAAQVLECLHVAFVPYEHLYTPAAFADTVLDSLTVNTRMQQMRVLVAASGDRVIGTVAGQGCSDGEGHLRGMAVLPDYQSTGVAQELLAAIERWLKANGCNRVTLDTTLPLERAMKFYERNGYKRSGHTADFFGMTLIEYEKNI